MRRCLLFDIYCFVFFISFLFIDSKIWQILAHLCFTLDFYRPNRISSLSMLLWQWEEDSWTFTTVTVIAVICRKWNASVILTALVVIDIKPSCHCLWLHHLYVSACCGLVSRSLGSLSTKFTFNQHCPIAAVSISNNGCYCTILILIMCKQMSHSSQA